ncbi:hypothetical protein FB451DRAFT_1167993 [Mycena latifolia]|nr:hypothetical protein FB451DRAFT_1167993 [Mycena latifolia]
MPPLEFYVSLFKRHVARQPEAASSVAVLTGMTSKVHDHTHGGVRYTERSLNPSLDQLTGTWMRNEITKCRGTHVDGKEHGRTGVDCVARLGDKLLADRWGRRCCRVQGQPRDGLEALRASEMNHRWATWPGHVRVRSCAASRVRRAADGDGDAVRGNRLVRRRGRAANAAGGLRCDGQEQTVGMVPYERQAKEYRMTDMDASLRRDWAKVQDWGEAVEGAECPLASGSWNITLWTRSPPTFYSTLPSIWVKAKTA